MLNTHGYSQQALQMNGQAIAPTRMALSNATLGPTVPNILDTSLTGQVPTIAVVTGAFAYTAAAQNQPPVKTYTLTGKFTNTGQPVTITMVGIYDQNGDLWFETPLTGGPQLVATNATVIVTETITLNP